MKSLSLFTLLAAALVAAATISTTTVDAYTYMVYRGTASCNTSEDGVSVMYYWSSINTCSESNDTNTNTNIYSSVSNCDATNGFYNTSYHGSNSTCENTPTNSSFMTGTCYSFGTTPPSSWRLSCENVTMNTTTTTMMMNTTMDNSTTTMMNSTNTTMMTNATTMASNSTSMMPTNGSWPPSNGSGTWWAWLEAQPMDPMTFVLNDFIVGLSGMLMVNSNVFNGTVGADGTVHITVYAWNATEIAYAATQLSPADFSALNVVNIFEASTTTSGSYTTITGINSTTATSMMPPNSSMPDNSSMPPGNSSMPPPMPTPPPAPPACNTLTFHVNCAQHSHCQEWNMTCVPKCSEANGNSSKCEMWPHCWNQPGTGSSSSTCHTSCAMLNRDSCFTSDDCSFYNGKCSLYCRHYGNDEAKCLADEKCRFDDSQVMKCEPKNCGWATDAYSCDHLIADGECDWMPDTNTCVPNCYRRTPATCEAFPECQLFAKGTSWQYCLHKCSARTSQMGCDVMSGCVWLNNMCQMDCNGIGNAADCNARPDCGSWDPTAMKCHTVNCSLFKNDTHSCNTRNNEDVCTVGDMMMCMNGCDNVMMMQNEMACNMNPLCMFDSTAMKCKSQPCNVTMNENECNFRRECTFAGGSCKPACENANGDWASCDMWSHCMWQSSRMKCLPKCTMQTTKNDCLGSNRQWFSDPDDGPCFWASDSLGCQQGRCEDYSENSTACSLQSFCVNKRDNMFDTCLASCGRALLEKDCNNLFFQSNLACMWNKDTMKCTDNCAYITSMQQCSGPCAWNYNFSACLPKGQDIMPSSTMMSSSSLPVNTTSADSTASPSTTSSDASSSTAAPTTTSVNNNNMGSTTSTMAPQTQAATTTTPAPPVGNPRVKFTLNATAAVSYESNTAEKVQEFLDKLAEVLGVPASSISGTFSASDNAVVVEFKQDAKDSSGNAVNVTAEVEKATNLTPTQMSSLGAASSETAAPAPAGGDAPEDEGPNIAVIAGAAAGGLILLLVILFVIKKQSSSGTGYSDDQVGDRPMLEVPHANQPGHPQL